MDIQKLNSKKLGKKGLEEIATYRVSRKKKDDKLSLKDVIEIKAQIKSYAEKKYDNYELKNIVFRSGGMFKTATNENNLLEYFQSSVKDPDKFLQFESVDFYIIYS